MVFLGGVQTIFKVFRGGQGLFTDSREGLEKIENKLGLSCAKLRIVELKLGVRNIEAKKCGIKIAVG